ncbi:MAG: N-acetylneuraminate synthase family protein [Robiginitomaculum sp.]|nr:N-acetylneuraminate synthase family protein [Robiginitomaculum sp.]
MSMEKNFQIGGREIGKNQPTWFIADIASSHDGELDRAVELIHLAAQAGADCAKFQHFLAKDIVSDVGFSQLTEQSSHQSSWKESVFEVFQKYETPRDWTEVLVQTCRDAGIEYMTTPYDLAALDIMDKYVGAYKIGSGDIGWVSFLQAIAKRKKPIFLATGAANITDVKRSVSAILEYNDDLCLMQCNTNYTGEVSNFSYINLNVLRTYSAMFPDLVLGLSDHTPGHATVLGAITLGARVVEKHFTDDNSRAGPDHGFSMNPKSWREMVDRSRELELALGDGIKRVEANETEAAIVQRRCLRLKSDLEAGHVLQESDLEALRPKPVGSVEPWQMNMVIGKVLAKPMRQGEALLLKDFL